MSRCAVMLLMLAGLFGCSPVATHKHQFIAFGTVITITIQHGDSDIIQTAFERLESDFLRMHEIWHPWRSKVINRTNQLLQSGYWFSAPTSVLPLLIRAKQIAIDSEHFFNPMLGKLIALWGFHRDNPDDAFVVDLKAIAAIQRDMPSMEDIEMDGIRLRGLHPHLQFDSGGIAKGYALDQAMQTLKTMGIEHALIDAGGDLAAIGGPQPGWTIGIQHPRATDKPSQLLARFQTIGDEGVFTSGDYRRFYFQGGKRRHHIIDPRTGFPVAHTIAATVIHSDRVLADAAATALIAAGERHWRSIARQLGVNHILILTTNGKLIMSQAMKRRLTLQFTEGLEVVVQRL